MTKIKLILKQYKWSVRDLHRKIEEQGETIPYYALTQMVNGKRTNYNIITLKKICSALDVSPNDIVEDEVKVFEQKQQGSRSNQSETHDLGF